MITLLHNVPFSQLEKRIKAYTALYAIPFDTVEIAVQGTFTEKHTRECVFLHSGGYRHVVRYTQRYLTIMDGDSHSTIDITNDCIETVVLFRKEEK